MKLIIMIHFQVNKDRSGSINFDEFVYMIANYVNEEQSGEDICEAFSVFDDGGNGIIPAKELKYFLTNLGEKLTDDEMGELMKLADTKKDGVIRYNSFVESIEGKKKKGRKTKKYSAYSA